MKKKAKPRGVPFKQGYDERRNLLGAPKRGESHAETLDFALGLTPQQVIDLIGKDNDLGRAFVDMPSDVPLKVLVHLRNIAAEMFEPSSGRLAVIMDRTEGKVPDKVDLNNSGTLKVIFVDDTDNDQTPETPPSASGGE